MGIEFRAASLAPLSELTVNAPPGAVIAVVSDDPAAQRLLLRLATGQAHPTSGTVKAPISARYFAPLDALDFEPADAIAVDHTLAACPAIPLDRALRSLERLRRDGATIFLATHDLALAERFADEVWWLHNGQLRAKGDPREVLHQYRHHIAQTLRDLDTDKPAPLRPSLRRGDGRAQLESLALHNSGGFPTATVMTGEETCIQLVIRFDAPVEDPVAGIMIRTRIGTEVYGINTEILERPLGPVQAGERLAVDFRFRCNLCPGDYTITAASHDPDGVWHDWMEDALAFTVTATRYAAGVANLCASAGVRKLP
jgi:lipopolysaccharide transport system ATP-binding protein